jgi:Tfp pilus assembly protein PilO
MSDVKLVRFAAVLIVLAGYAFVFRAGEEHIGERIAENARIADQVRAGERALMMRPVLERERVHLNKQFRSAAVAADRSALVARFLREAAAIALAQHTTITAIAATGAQAAITASGAQAANATAAGRTAPLPADDPFDGIPLEMTLEGHYADVLATVRALSAGRVLAAVDVASLARKNAGAVDGVLTASLRVVLERIVPNAAPAAESAGAEPRPV